ncbi:MAG: Ig-like domain-containing protein [Pseudomonadota bacterium]
MKPLVLFSSLAVLCAGGLMALSYKGLQDDPSALTSLSSGSQTVNIKPAEAESTPPATGQSAETKAAPSEKAEEKVAAVSPEPETVETAPSAETEPAAKLGEDTAKPEAAEAEPEGASFDIVRVEEDGSAVLAGRAEPGSTVRLLINEKVAGETKANDRGEWVVIPAEPMPAGAHQMQIQTENAAGEVKLAEQSVALTVPDQPGTQPLIVLSETAKPSKVLQKPEAAEVKQAEAAPESATDKSAGETTAAGQQQPVADSKTAALEPPANKGRASPSPRGRRSPIAPSRNGPSGRPPTGQ